MPPSNDCIASMTFEGQCLLKTFNHRAKLESKKTDWQNIPSTRRDIVLVLLDCCTRRSEVFSSLTISASNPASSMVSSTSSETFCRSTVTFAEWPIRSTTTFKTPSISETNLVIVLEHDAQVIPPIDNKMRNGPSLIEGEVD